MTVVAAHGVGGGRHAGALDLGLSQTQPERPGLDPAGPYQHHLARLQTHASRGQTSVSTEKPSDRDRQMDDSVRELRPLLRVPVLLGRSTSAATTALPNLPAMAAWRAWVPRSTWARS
jgi:hypothetical protein